MAGERQQLRVYFDDSGHEDSTPVFVVAGYVASVQVWEQVETELARVLRLVGARTVKMAHLCGSRGFNEFEGWTRERRDALLDEVGTIIGHHLEHGVGRGIFVDDLRRLLTPADELFTKGTPVRRLAAVAWCLRMALEWLAIAWQERPAGAKVDVVIEAGTKGLGQAVPYLHALVQAKPWGDAIGTISVVGKHDAVAIQTGDFLAYNVYQYLLAQRRGETYDRPCWRNSLGGTRVNIGWLTEPAIRAMLDSFQLRDLLGGEEIL